MIEYYGVSSFGGTSEVVVSIERNSPHQRHLGMICYSASQGTTKLLELKDHKKLAFDDPKPDTPFVRISLPKRAHRQLIQWCRQVYLVNEVGGVEFGFEGPVGALDPDTARYLEANHGGLTCSSLILAVFHAYGTPIIDYTSWPLRGADTKWQEKFLEWLKTYFPPHAQKAAAGVGSVRYRPEEVAAAARTKPWPCTFGSIVGDSLEIVKILEQDAA